MAAHRSSGPRPTTPRLNQRSPRRAADMADRFAGRRCIVTGASRGIGPAIAERLAAEGASVVITARTVDQHDHLAGSLRETLERCRRYGTTVEVVAADLADPD